MSRAIIIILLVLGGVALGFAVVVGVLPEPPVKKPREEIIVGIKDLRSNLWGQPVLSKRGVIVEAPKGHPEGHIVSTVPRELPPGRYGVEMEIAIKTGQENPINPCVMDLLSGSRQIATYKVEATGEEIVGDQPHIGFNSPGPDGSKSFQARLFCNGQAAVSVYSVMFIRNPVSDG